VGTTTGTVPVGATTVAQTARRGTTARTAKGTCRVMAVRNTKTRRVIRRDYRCTIRLATKGTWTITTTARGKAGVVAQGTRRVVVR
jgi:hypothetical protein